MKTKKIITITLVFILILTSTSLAFANTSKHAIDGKAIQLREELKTQLPNFLKQHYKKNSSIDSSLGKVISVEKKVILDKTNDLNALKLSFEEPVVIYREKITTEIITPLGASLIIDESSTVETNGGTTVAYTNELQAYKDEVTAISAYYKLSKIDLYWSTNNVATGDSDSYGGYINKIEFRTDQSGLDYNDDYHHPVDIDKTVTFASSNSSGSYTKTFSHSTYSYVTDGGLGACITTAKFYITFVFPGYPYASTTTDIVNSGFGYIANPF